MDGNAQTIIVEGQYQRINNILGYPIRFSSNVSDLGELLDDQHVGLFIDSGCQEDIGERFCGKHSGLL
jgi:hypothetical protein